MLCKNIIFFFCERSSSFNASEEPSKKVSDRPKNTLTLTVGMRLNRGLPRINTMMNPMNLGCHLLNPKNMLPQRRISPLQLDTGLQSPLWLSSTKRGYQEACEYLDFWNKTVLIQHRALTCLSKSLAHMLQRELYTMGNTGLLRREAEMTLLQPHLGETRHLEVRNSPFWQSSLFKSQLVKEGEDFLLKKADLGRLL